jgi:hypothetical protein
MGPYGVTAHDLTLTKLDDWRNIGAIAHVSGVGSYSTTLRVPPSWTVPDLGAYLDLGVAYGSIQALLNGRLVAPDIRPVRPFDVTQLLRPGANQLVVVLATTLANELLYQEENGYPAAAASGSPATVSTQAYGLLGPVSLIPFSRAVV